jgi:hypothetical protein
MLISIQALLLGLLGILRPTWGATLIPFRSVSIPLQNLFDNQAASPDGSADFDGHGGSFDSTLLPSGPFIYDGVNVSGIFLSLVQKI